MEREIINRVTQSPLITIDLEEFYTQGERILYDLKDNLHEGLILKEKAFREFIKTHDWSNYDGKHVAIYCSTDAIIPSWAYMLITTKLEPYANSVIYGDLSQLEAELFRQKISKINLNDYRGKKVVIKGCSKINVPLSAYIEITRLLRPLASSIMYGEPCSTVPIFKANRN